MTATGIAAARTVGRPTEDHVAAVLARVRDLVPHIGARGSATESLGRVPAAVIAMLTEAGVFRLTKPVRYGGLG